MVGVNLLMSYNTPWKIITAVLLCNQFQLRTLRVWCNAVGRCVSTPDASTARCIRNVLEGVNVLARCAEWVGYVTSAMYMQDYDRTIRTSGVFSLDLSRTPPPILSQQNSQAWEARQMVPLCGDCSSLQYTEKALLWMVKVSTNMFFIQGKRKLRHGFSSYTLFCLQ